MENGRVTDLETAVGRLHAAPLEDFVAERKRLAKELRAAGDRESAAQLAKLPKPSAPAWALNLVARERPEVVGGWLDSAEALRDASTHADRASGDALRAAMAAHRDATRAVLATVRSEARPNGRELSEPMLDRAREILQAATADPVRAELLREGRVVEGDEEPAALPEPDEEGGGRDRRGSKDRTSSGRAAKDRTPTDRASRGGETKGAGDRVAERRAEQERRATASRPRSSRSCPSRALRRGR